MGSIVLGLVCVGLGFLFVLTLMRISDEEDRTARHTHKNIDPFADVTITRQGAGKS
jgi:hypothetical protein